LSVKHFKEPVPRVQLRMRFLLGEDVAFGPGKIALLESIEQTGSISAAARVHKMSYRRAWLLVDEMNRCFELPVVITATGGKAGGGAALTDLGRKLAELYRQAEEAALRACAPQVASILERARLGEGRREAKSRPR
jgi:molybdate transport system regulatory protein